MSKQQPLNEQIQRIRTLMNLNEEYLEEMAYPVEFDMNEFKSINSFAGRIRYSKEKLLGRLGSGSGRAVFRIDNEKVLKVALNKKGLAQNSVESEGYKQEYDILARVFDIDNDYTWIEMERAVKVTPTRFKELTGTSIDGLGNWLRSKKGETTYGEVPDLDENEFAGDIQQFVADYDYPVPGDFDRISSYGEVKRDGRAKIIVIDFGLDKGTSDEFYNWKKKAEQRRYQY